MDHETSFDDTSAALELRVLSGPQAGARAPLATAHVFVLVAGAGADDGDIVLRDESAAPVRVRIAAAAGIAMLDVVEGPVMLGGEPLAAGETHAWPMHAPLRVGGTVVAFGFASVEDWPKETATSSDATHDAGHDAGREPAQPAARPPKRRSAAWLVALGLLVTVASAAAIGVVQVMSPHEPAVAKPPPLADMLRDSEFAGLTATQDATGRVEVRGRLQTLAQRTQLDGWLAARGVAPAVNVFVEEGVARDVVNVFRVNGVAVQASVEGPGRIAAEAAEPDRALLARAEEVVRRDVRGLVELRVANRAAPPPPPPRAPMPDDPGKRIASVVPGDPAYLVTVDGARYFIGAMLPSGHRITAIAGQRVSLERDGQATTLNL
jgi:type III secretion protein D